MKKLLLILTIMLTLITGMVTAQTTVPPDVDTGIYAKVQQEHKNTRKFFSDELTRQRTQMFKDADERGVYYEDLFISTIKSLLWKLGLTIAAIVFFFFGLSRLLMVRLEKKKFEKFKKTVMADLRQELNLPQRIISPVGHTITEKDGIKITGQRLPPEARIQHPLLSQQQESVVLPGTIQKPQQPPPQPVSKKGYFERRKEKKNQARVQALQKEIDKIKGKASLPTPAPAQTQQPEMNYNFEVNYGC